MNYYLAPMEGITGYVFRNALHEYFGPLDKYFTPFVSPTQNGCFTPKEYRDIMPENNRIPGVVPQILANNAGYFNETAHELFQMGYEEVNLNLGCPSGTVVSKKKGSGFLSVPWQLDAFLEQIYEKAEGKISIKTRLGLDDVEEFEGLLELFERYPVAELTIHPRVRAEYYKGAVHRDVFYRVAGKCKLPLCYNGDLWTPEDVREVTEKSGVQAVMFGRGLLKNPGIVRECYGEHRAEPLRIQEFSDRIYEEYAQIMGSHNAMFKMKELWLYLGQFFTKEERVLKPLKKAGTAEEMKNAVHRLILEQVL